MGTLLYARGVPFDHCFDELNVSQRELVLNVHLDYLRAGAEMIETNTFGANAVRLAAHGLSDGVRDFNWHGAKLAKEARDIFGRPVPVRNAEYIVRTDRFRFPITSHARRWQRHR